MQEGPTNEALERIEAVRARDIQAHLERKDKKQQARKAKAGAKTKRQSKKSPDGASQRLFGVSEASTTIRFNLDLYGCLAGNQQCRRTSARE